ncbi:hypothetical protein ACFQZX_09640 [Mucilaginibacter litoreus]|uniref:Uncharacterized protein n=1 Tax=Mucilaginibacter litoreus TaxID=1048221 RepID=A0ABW3ATT4_9SPHI
MELQNDNQHEEPKAYRVNDDDNLEEKDLRKQTFLFGTEEKDGTEPGMEANGAGGQNFGESNVTPSGDDPNNPSQNAGYDNEYFKRAEPSEEHPEFQNFKDPNQLGQPNYSEATGAVPTGQSDEENAAPAKEGSDENKNDQNENFQEGTADNDGHNTGINSDGDVAGYNELPDQQKVGE